MEPTALLQLQPGTEWLRGSDFMMEGERETERERDTERESEREEGGRNVGGDTISKCKCECECACVCVCLQRVIGGLTE